MVRLPAPAGFVSSEDIWAHLRLSDETRARQLRKCGVQLYRHPNDHRVKLMREEDAKRLMAPVPVVAKAVAS